MLPKKQWQFTISAITSAVLLVGSYFFGWPVWVYNMGVGMGIVTLYFSCDKHPVLRLLILWLVLGSLGNLILPEGLFSLFK